MKRNVLITCKQLQQTIDFYRSLFSEQGIEIELPHIVQKLDESELFKIIDRFDGVIAGDDEFTTKVLEKGKRLKVIAKWGVGVDAIDIEAANRLGIRVSNTPNVFGDEVADVVIGYIILLARQLHKLDQSIRKGNWNKIQGISLSGKTLGVIGVGSIGRALVKRALAAKMNIVGYDEAAIQPSFVKEIGLRIATFEELLKVSDFISLNCNLTSLNRHMLGDPEFAIMKKGVFIINTARGPLIDENALANALREGKVAGAALDVFEEEPLSPDSPLREFDSCIFGAHNSSNTYEAVMRTNELAIRNLLDGLKV
ncbi:MAG: phosphoglycerate dehydrogenase [Candidatus Methanoperedens sp.]|nr:phosphoglycerate dehydrogenase [Candidatus Methanoperedens sp.]CAG0969706.1 D-3-phosphoglycerate dehydrogenase / 2-oxoglutarate reductase [Methanosarcinales archaeon]